MCQKSLLVLAVAVLSQAVSIFQNCGEEAFFKELPPEFNLGELCHIMGRHNVL